MRGLFRTGARSATSKNNFVKVVFRGHDSLDIALGEHPEGTCIARADSSGPSSQLPVGGLILAINGEEMVGLPADAVAMVIDTSSRPLTMVVEKPTPERTMTATFGEGTIGIHLQDSQSGTAVGAVDAGSPAHALEVPVGGIIVGVNGENVESLDVAVVRTMIGTSARPLTLTIKVGGGIAEVQSPAVRAQPLCGLGISSESGMRAAPPPVLPLVLPSASPPALPAALPPASPMVVEKPTPERTMTATFGEGTIGIHLQDSQSGTAVGAVDAGSPAHALEVPVGGIIVGVNGENVESLDVAVVRTMIGTSARPLTLTIKVGGGIAEVQSPAVRAQPLCGLGISSESGMRAAPPPVLPLVLPSASPPALPAALPPASPMAATSGARQPDVQCAVCTLLNPPSMRHCNACGTALERRCTFGAGPLGLTLVDDATEGTRIGAVAPGTQASALDVPEAGVIVAVNDVSTAGETRDVLCVLIGTAVRPLTLTIRPPRSSCS